MRKLLLMLVMIIATSVTAQTFQTKILYIDGEKYSSTNTIWLDMINGVISHTNGLNNYPIKLNRKVVEDDHFVYYFDANITPSTFLNNSELRTYGVRHFRLVVDKENNFLGFIEIKGNVDKYSILKYYP